MLEQGEDWAGVGERGVVGLMEAHGHSREWGHTLVITVHNALCMLTDQWVPHVKTNEITTRDAVARWEEQNGEY
jgi:hypothetical protein